MKEVKMPSLLEMLKAGVHFGHQTSNWHPKMAPYIFADRAGVHIINLEKTQKKLEEALKFVSGIAERGGTVLFVGTKDQVKDIIKKNAQECGMPHVNERWLGGTLTNFASIAKLIKKLKDLKVKKDDEGKYTKKERLVFEREAEKLDEIIGGISDMEKVPDAIYVVDVKNEKTVVREANKKGVPVVAMTDTNINPDAVDYVIPSNDDAIKSVEMITSLIAEAIKQNKKEASAGAPSASVNNKKSLSKKDNKDSGKEDKK